MFKLCCILTSSALIVLLVCSDFLLFLGGWKLKVEPRLTLNKEDTTLYHLAKIINDRVDTEALKQCQIVHSKHRHVLTLCCVFLSLRSRDAPESLT